jgi:hypothetical protein
MVHFIERPSIKSFGKYDKSQKLVKFGSNNMFPTDLVELSMASPINSSIHRAVVNHIYAKGLTPREDTRGTVVGAPCPGGSWNTLYRKLAYDYKMFGGFAIQVVYNKDKSTVSLFHQSYPQVRIGQLDEFGTPLTYKAAIDWKEVYGKNKVVEFKAWMGEPEKIDTQEDPTVMEAPEDTYLYVHYDYIAGMKAYTVPDYFPAWDYLRADAALAEFYNNTINNGFTPSAIVFMPTNPAQEIKDKVRADLRKNYQGTRGAGEVIVIWGAGGDPNSKPQINEFDGSNNADLYNNVESIIFQKIISSHRLNSPTLAGVSGSGNLSGNASEIIDSFILYNETVIEEYQDTILEALNKFTTINKTAPLGVKESDIIDKLGKKA